MVTAVILSTRNDVLRSCAMWRASDLKSHTHSNERPPSHTHVQRDHARADSNQHPILRPPI